MQHLMQSHLKYFPFVTMGHQEHISPGSLVPYSLLICPPPTPIPHPPNPRSVSFIFYFIWKVGANILFLFADLWQGEFYKYVLMCIYRTDVRF